MDIIPDELIEEIGRHIEVITKDKEYGFDFSMKDFIKSMSIIKPQSYGKRIENKIIKDLDSIAVSSRDDKGDMLSKKGDYYEIKISLLTKTNNNLNMVQIRPWQKIDYYLCIAFDIRDLKNFKTFAFLLKKEDMLNEMKEVNASSAHGTKKALLENKHIELRYSLKISEKDEVFKRWMKNYNVDYALLRKNMKTTE